MMTCRTLTECLHELLAGELPSDRRADADDHLRACPPCVVLYETYRITIQLVRTLPPAEPPSTLSTRLNSILCGGQEPRTE